jgi:hypothetical protein
MSGSTSAAHRKAWPPNLDDLAKNRIMAVKDGYAALR